MDTDDRMDNIPNEQEWKRWRILQQMQESARFGDFTQDEIEETKMAFGFTKERTNGQDRSSVY